MLTEVKKDRAVNVLLNTLKEYVIDIKLYNLFRYNKKTLGEIGICNGVSKLIDLELQKIHPEICILSLDNIAKFRKDLDYVDAEKNIRSTVTGLPPKKKR